MTARSKFAILARLMGTLLASASLATAGDFDALVGGWTGEAVAVNNFVTQDPFGIHLTISADGRIQGTAGDAVIASGSITRVPHGIARLFIHADYELALTLQGNLFERDGVHRTTLTIYATHSENQAGAGPEWQAFAATDGSKLYPGAAAKAMKNGMRIQTRIFALKRKADE